MKPRILASLAIALATLAFVLAMRLAVGGALPAIATSFLACATLLTLVATSFRALVVFGPCATDERGERRELHRRHGFWVLAVGICVALPTLGTFGLVDPWETHYAEVAREMIERRDFVSLWWANEGFFQSKPVLTFWLEAGAMALFGVGTGPNQPIAGGAHPEWAIRFPAFACALLATYALYHGVSRTAGRRAGFVSAIVLATAPGFALLSHQAMTDMPLVAGAAASLGLFMRALAIPDARETRTPAAARLLAVALVLGVAAQIALFAASRALAGSPHACGLPSQPPCAPIHFAVPRLSTFVIASVVAAPTTWLAMHVAEERRVARLYACGAWACAALAVMAKGPAGAVVPLAGCAAAVLSLRSPRMALRLAPHVGAVVLAVLVVPWYVASVARHGRPFFDELVMRHMLGRTLEHLHDTNGGEDVGLAYYVRQLGYATFPWSGVTAVAAMSATERPDDGSRRLLPRAMAFGAALVAFGLVSAMKTKFHHYVLVALPPLAVVTGMFVDERLDAVRGRARQAWTVLLLTAAAAITALVVRDVVAAPARFVQLLTYRYSRTWPSTASFADVLVVVGTVVVLALGAMAWGRLRRVAFGAAAASAVLFAALLLDTYLPRCARDGGQRAIFDAYYAEQPRGPIVAYQLNWKGENFYSGNDVAIFVSSGAPMRAYLEQRRGERVYFVTERARVPSLRSELVFARTFAEITKTDDSYEFVLVRADL